MSAWDSLPDDGTQGMPKHLGRKHCVACFQFPASEELVKLVEFDMRST